MRERGADALVIGGSLGGVAAALGAARAGLRVIVTEETRWLGGQATTQGVPLDEHPWIERYGCTRSYRDFRNAVRDHYRRHYPLSAEAATDRHLNPGAGWVSALCFEPRAGLAAIEAMLAAHRTAGNLTVLTEHAPLAVESEGDRVRSISVRDLHSGDCLQLHAPFVLDATELGDLLALAGVEHVTGAESRYQTGEPAALDGPAEPLRQQGFTHLAAVDYLPGQDHTIERPQHYDRWRPSFGRMVGWAETGQEESQIRMLRLFAPSMMDQEGEMRRACRYEACIWNFRRVFCRDNFAPGAFPSDITMLMNGNEYRVGPLAGVSEEEQAAHRRAARELTLSLLYFLQTEIEPGYRGRAGFPGLRPRGDVFGTYDGLAQYPYIRESRRLHAEFTPVEQHFRVDAPGNENGPVPYPDSVGVGGYRIDIHEPARSGQSLTVDLHGKHWPQQIPLGALIPMRVENLLAACKNLGATHVTNGCYRLHPTEWNIGEAAGMLAAFCLRRGEKPRAVRNTPALLADFQTELVRAGVETAWPGLQTARSYNSHYVQVPRWHWGQAHLAQQER